MVTLADLAQPFKNQAPRKFFEALVTGSKTGQELVDTGAVSKLRRVPEMAAFVSSICGIRVTANGKPEDPHTKWTLEITDPAGPLVRRATVAAVVSSLVSDEPLPKIKDLKAPPKIGLYLPPPEFPWVKDSSEEGNNIFLVGPSGSGKTEMAAQVAKVLKAEFIRQNFNGETTVDNLIGYTEIANESGVAVTSWHDGELARAVKLAAKGETKVVYLADEVTAGKPEVLFQFHRVLELKKDGSREMEINGELYVVKAGFLTIIGASNSFRADETGLFQGTQTMNMAFANRWTGGVFYVGYAPNEHEIMEACGIDPRIAKALQQMALGIRKKGEEENYPVVCSTRQLIAIGKKAMKWGCLKALQFVYLNTLTSDERAKVADPVIKSMSWPRK